MVNSQQCYDWSHLKVGYSKCKNKVCTDYSGTVTLTNCQNFLSTCVSLRDNSACQTIAATCATYTVNLCLQATEGRCNWTGSAC